jgi:AcrR family transcriptional regulator
MFLKMARTTKTPDERREEIIDASLELFCEKGYENSSVQSIVKKVGIAQGTFYYYFKSKEEIIDSIIDEYFNAVIKILMPVINDKKMNALEKIEGILRKEFGFIGDEKNGERIVKLHFIEEMSVHQKLLTLHVVRYAPLITKIIKQGVKEGLVKTEHPLESVEMFLVGFHFLFDTGILAFTESDYKRRADAIGHIIENTFGTERGSFSFFTPMIKNILRKFYECKKTDIKA